jgi:hypothetical protein
VRLEFNVIDEAIRDAAAVVTLLNGVVLVARQRSWHSVFWAMLLGTFVWFMLFRSAVPDTGAGLAMLLIFGYLLAVSIGVITQKIREALNRSIVRLFFGKKGEKRWQSAVERAKETLREYGPR